MSAKAYKEYLHTQMHALAEKLEASQAEVLRLRSELERALTPVEQLAGTKPLVLYFKTDQDRQEFVEIVQSELPGLQEVMVP